MSNIATAYVELRVKSDKARGEAQAQARGVAQEMTKTFAQYFSAAVVVNELRKVIGAASDLEQAVGGTEAVFGEAQGTINDFATHSAKDFGISERAARELTSQIGALLKGFGFTKEEAASTGVELAKLGSDLAAAFGGNPDEAVLALGSALRGEFDPLEKFGVSLTASKIALKAVEMGLADSTASVDANAKAQAALALITEQTTDIQGQSGREAETAAGRTARLTATLEDARAKLGAELLPLFSKIVGYLQLLIDGFTSLPGPVQTAIVALVAIAAVAGPINSTIKAFGGLKDMISKIRTLSPQVATGIGIMAVALLAYELNARKAAANSREYADSLDELTRASDADRLDVFNDTLAKGVFAGKSMADVVDELTRGNIGLTETMIAQIQADGLVIDGKNRTEEALDALFDARNREIIALSEQAEAEAKTAATTDLATGASKSATDALGDAAGTVEMYTEFQHGLRDELLGASTDTAKFAERSERTAKVLEDQAAQTVTVGRNTRELRDQFDEASDAADGLRAAIDKVFGGYVDLEDATTGVYEKTAALTVALEENGRTLDISTEKGRANRKAVEDQVAGILDYGVALVRSGKSNEEAADAVSFLTAGLRDQLDQAGFTEDQINDYLATLGLTPENVTTTLDLANDEQAKADVQAYLDSLNNLPPERVTEIQALIDQGAYAEAQQLLDNLAHTRVVSYRPAGGRGLIQSAEGRFVSGGSNLMSTLGEIEGRRGDEVVLPLGDPGRIAQLLALPGVGERVADALPQPSGGGGWFEGGPITLIIEGRPFTAIIARRERQLVGALAAGRR